MDSKTAPEAVFDDIRSIKVVHEDFIKELFIDTIGLSDTKLSGRGLWDRN